MRNLFENFELLIVAAVFTLICVYIYVDIIIFDSFASAAVDSNAEVPVGFEGVKESAEKLVLPTVLIMVAALLLLGIVHLGAPQKQKTATSQRAIPNNIELKSNSNAVSDKDVANGSIMGTGKRKISLD